MKVPDLVEEDGAAVGSLELADLELVRAREGASLITKQLALEELARHGGAVDLDEWPRPPGREVVDRPRDQLLAGARLTRDENGDVNAGRFTEDLTRFQHLRAAPEVQLASDAPGGLLGRRSKRLRLGANEGVDGLLELIEAQRLVEYRFRRERGGGGAVVSMVGDRDDGTAIPTVKLQTLNQLFGVGSVAGEIDQREDEAAIRERLPGFVRGRDGDALVSADSQKAEESQLRCRVDFDHERSSLSHHAQMADERKWHTRSFFAAREPYRLRIF